MSNILLVGDVHLHPKHSNERMTWLGNLVVDRKPDIIIQIGDMSDLPSLSSFDVGKKTFEGRRYSDDCKATHDGLAKFQAPIDEYNKKLKVNKSKHYNPKKYLCGGNHENRIAKAVNSDPKLDGTMGIDDLKYKEFGWEFIQFLKPLIIDGVMFQHYLVSGSMDRSISSENTGRAFIKKYHTSVFAGHSHKLDLAWEAGQNGLMMSGTIGCYFTHFEDWQSVAAQSQFWRGVLLLKGVKNGVITEGHEAITMDYIKKAYK